jgi:hypothetical protein
MVGIGVILWIPSQRAHANEWAIGGGYLGETLTHPGIVGVVEYRITGQSRHQALLAADLGIYWHPRSQVAPHLDVRGGWRYVSKQRYSADLTVGVGYLRSYIAAETVNYSNTGRSQLLIPIDLGFFGWAVAPNSAHPMRIASSLRLLNVGPVNRHRVIRPALTLTLTRAL